MSQVSDAVERAQEKAGMVDTTNPVGDTIHGLVEALIVMCHEVDNLRAEITELKNRFEQRHE